MATFAQKLSSSSSIHVNIMMANMLSGPHIHIHDVRQKLMKCEPTLIVRAEVIKDAFQCGYLYLLACLSALMPLCFHSSLIYLLSFILWMFVAKCWFANWFTVCLRFKYQFTFAIHHSGNVFTLPFGLLFHLPLVASNSLLHFICFR